MADEAKKVALVVTSCTKKTFGDGTESYEIVGTVDGTQGTYYSKEEWAVGSHEANQYPGKKALYKVKGGAGNMGAKRDYAIENRQRAADAAIEYGKGKDWDIHTTLSLADVLVDYYKTGNKPPKK